MVALGVVLAGYALVLGVYASQRPVPAENQNLAGRLVANYLDYGLAPSYWLANIVTLDSGGHPRSGRCPLLRQARHALRLGLQAAVVQPGGRHRRLRCHRRHSRIGGVELGPGLGQKHVRVARPHLQVPAVDRARLEQEPLSQLSQTARHPAILPPRSRDLTACYPRLTRRDPRFGRCPPGGRRFVRSATCADAVVMCAPRRSLCVWTGAYSGWRTSTALPVPSVASGGCPRMRWRATCSAGSCRGGESSNVFLRNGARLYLDVGSHPEYATSECDNVARPGRT